MSDDVTRILNEIEQGDQEATERLLPLVYDELRRLATAKLSVEKPGQTLQATALVHEAYMRLVNVDVGPKWNGRGHFFGAAAEAMRRILIDRAKEKKRLKRGGDRQRVDLDAIEIALDTPAEELVALNESLIQLEKEHPDCAALVKLRFFAGLSQKDAAAALDIPRRTADRAWAFSRAWLHKRLRNENSSTDL